METTSYVVFSFAVGIGAMCGWWARGRRHGDIRSSPDPRARPDEDDLITVRHLSHEILTTQRRMASQLNDLTERVELLGGRIEALVRPEARPSVVTPPTYDLERGPAEYDLITRPNPESLRTRLPSDDWVSIEAAAKEFLSAADVREFDNIAVGQFFAQRDLAISFVLMLDNRWAMIAIHESKSETNAIGIPAIRIGMRQIDLHPYFDLVNYNGLDPIRGTQVTRLAKLTRTSGKWVATEKGLVDGSS